ncbi:MAG: hypothetical protein IRY86_03825 [Thermorudis peleae]|nr:hypothetical protein [Thermorudis peleae]
MRWWRWFFFALLPRSARRPASRILDLYDLSRGRTRQVERRWVRRAIRRSLRRTWR